MPRRLLLIVLALALSIGGVVLVTLFLPKGGGRPAPAAAAPKPAPEVLVARNGLPVGAFVQPNDLAWQSWGDGPLPPTYITSKTGGPADFSGAVVRVPLAPGDPIIASHVVKPGDRGFMAAVLQPGDRAITINVNPATGVAGFLQPGDHVDLMLTQTVQEGGQSRHVSETILHGVRIVGLDQTFNAAGPPAAGDGRKAPALSPPRTATLEVTPKQAEIIAVANDMGVLTLLLNSLAGQNSEQADARVTRTWGSEATRLEPSGGPAAQGDHSATGPSIWTVEVVRGGSVTQTPVPFSGRGGAEGAP